jgi:hypothetical protein
VEPPILEPPLATPALAFLMALREAATSGEQAGHRTGGLVLTWVRQLEAA